MKKVVFMDRDGVICKDKEDYVKSWQEFSFLPLSLEALKLLNKNDYKVVIVTNQSVIGRGIISVSALEEINKRMEEEIEKREGRIERIYYCPHHPEAKCFCRKPNPGLLIKAIEELNIETASSWLIGDSPRDIVAGKRIGIRTILVLSGKTTQWPPSDFSSFMLDKEEKKAEIKLPDYISSNLYFAVKLILNIDSYFKIET